MKRTFLALGIVSLTVAVLQSAAFAQPVEIPTWTGAYTDTHTNITYPFTMVGGNPSNTGSTTIPVYLIPLPLFFESSTCNSQNHMFDPGVSLPNGDTVIGNTIKSPIFQPISALGNLQYIDAFQRENFWGVVQNNLNYHLLLQQPTLVPAPPVLTVPYNDRAGHQGQALDYAPYGGCVGVVDPAWIEGMIEAMLPTMPQVQTNSLAFFLLYDVFIGYNPFHFATGAGHHGWIPRSTGRQTLLWATYSDGQCFDAHGSQVPCPLQDVADVSHEFAEWADNPYTSNWGCGQPNDLEVADPLIAHIYPYTGVNGFGYNLQDLVFLPWFGAPSNTSLNGYLSFQHEQMTYCITQ